MSLPFSAAERDGLGTSTHVAGSAGGTVRGLCLDTVPWGAVGKINLREKHGLKGYMHPSVHCRTVYNSQDMEAT